MRIEQDELVFSFPEVHRKAMLRVRLLCYPSPSDAERGHVFRMPLRLLHEYRANLGRQWNGEEGTIIPLYQGENVEFLFNPTFDHRHKLPCFFAVQASINGLCVLTSEPWTGQLKQTPKENYLVVPEDLSLYGFKYQNDDNRYPFEAPHTKHNALLGEWQMHKSPDFLYRTILLKIYPMKRASYETLERDGLPWNVREYYMRVFRSHPSGDFDPCLGPIEPPSPDPTRDERCGVDAWDANVATVHRVHLISSDAWRLLTGEEAVLSRKRITEDEFQANPYEMR